MKKILRYLFDIILKKKKILIIYRYGQAVGDHLLITGLIKLIKSQYDYKIFVFTCYPDLFKNNKKIEKVFKLKFNLLSSLLVKFFNFLKCENIKEFLNRSNNPGKIFGLSQFKDIHITQYSNQDRTIAYLSERLFNFYIHLNKYKYKELPYLLNEF